MLQRSATLTTLREMNTQTVFQSIQLGHPISRAEIARRLAMAKPTVALALETLLEAGLVRQAAKPAGLNYGAVYFEPVPEVAHLLALDLGGRFLRGVVCDLDGTIRARRDLALTPADPASVIAGVQELRSELLQAAGLPGSAVAGAVVGVPAVVDPASGRMRQSSLPELEGFGVVEALTEVLEVPTAVENDVNLAALGEQWRGAGREVEDFAFLSIGTGVGAGLVLGGQLHRGRHGAAGEVDQPAPEEAFTPDSPAADAFLAMATQRLAAFPGTTRLAAPLSSEGIFAAYRHGDVLAGEIVAEEVRRIAGMAAAVAKVVDVELIVLGGGIGANDPTLPERIARELAALVAYPPRLAVSALGDAAVLTGAVAVATRTARTRVVAERVRSAVPRV